MADIFELFERVCDPTQATYDIQKAADLLPHMKAATAFARDAETLAKGRRALEQALVATAHAGEDVERLYVILRPLEYSAVLGASPQRGLVEGIYLLRLLAGNKIGEFHTALERLDAETRACPLVAFPADLEQFLTEGNYARLRAACQNSPSPFFAEYLKLLVANARESVADCLEAAYKSMSVEEAARMLMLSSADELATFAYERRWKLRDDGTVRFVKQKGPTISDMSVSYTSLSLSAIMQTDDSTPTRSLIENAILYAKEIEKIV